MSLRSAAPVVLVVVLFATACGAGTVAEDSDPGVPAAGSAELAAGPSVGASAAPASAAGEAEPSEQPLDLAVDACSLLDLATVESLTGVSTTYTTDSSTSASDSHCFWGSTKPGEPGYVELRLFRQRSLSGYTFGDGCSVTPVDGVGVEAAFVDCPPNPQTKLSLLAYERNAIVSLMVNEPASPLSADDLASVVDSVLAQLR